METSNLVSADSFFAPWDLLAFDWQSSQAQIQEILRLATPTRDIVWRGVSSASYPLQSSLYRHLMASNGKPPSEEQMLAAEKRILRIARHEWRFDNLTALEIFAQIQHFGGPTRLLDVSYNPLIALWFAVEEKFDANGESSDSVDARVFAFDVTQNQLKLDGQWGSYEIPWRDGNQKGWGTRLPAVWRPPAYNSRIPAQNSAFLLGGVPKMRSGENAKYRKGPGDGTSTGTWRISEVRLATSVSLAMNLGERNLQARSTPTFSIRISAEAKSGIRKILEKHFGYDSASLYPDLYGLSKFGLRQL